MSLKIKYNNYPSIGGLIKQLNKTVEDNIKLLRVFQDEITPAPICKIEILLEKLKKNMSGEKVVFSLSEQSSLAYYFCEFEDVYRDYYLNEYLPKHWNKSLVKGLMHSILHYYDIKFVVDSIRNVLNKNLDGLSLLQKDAYQYFATDEGHMKLGEELRRRKVSVVNAPSYVLMQNTMFVYPYFQYVIKAFFGNRSVVNQDLKEELKAALSAYNNSKFNRILLPIIVVAASKNRVITKETKDNCISLCNEFIAPYNEYPRWMDDTLSDSEKSSLRDAHHVIKRWILERAIIYVFNGGADNDYLSARSRFWKDYTGTLLQMNEGQDICKFFKVYSTNRDIRTNLNIKGIGAHSFLYQTTDETVVLMRFGDYSIVEFLSGGCMYIYKNVSANNTCKYKAIWKDRIDYADSLKSFQCTELVHDDVKSLNIHHLPNEFKIAHRGDWQTVYTRLLRLIGITI